MQRTKRAPNEVDNMVFGACPVNVSQQTPGARPVNTVIENK
jgi:hypothetical protein